MTNSSVIDRYGSIKKYAEKNYKNSLVYEVPISNGQSVLVTYPVPNTSNKTAAIIAKYPSPIEIRYDCSYDVWSCANGQNYYSEFYSFVVIETASPFVDGILKSLKFIP